VASSDPQATVALLRHRTGPRLPQGRPYEAVELKSGAHAEANAVRPAVDWASVQEFHPSGRSALERVAVRPCSGVGQLYVAGRRGWMVNPSFPSTLTAPVFPPSKSPEARRWAVANS
jgi:hypothetical protein